MVKAFCISIWYTGLYLLGTSPLQAQETARPGQWRSYLSHTNCMQITARGTLLIGINPTGLLTYETTDGAYMHHTTLTGLNDNEPSALFYNPYEDYTLIGYTSGMLDIFRQPGAFRAIPDIYLSQNVVRKSVRSMAASPDFTYIAGDFGIVAFDLERMESRFNYSQFPGAQSGSPAVKWVATSADSLYAVLENGSLISGRLSDNLADILRWHQMSGQQGLPADAITQLAVMPWGLFVLANGTPYQRNPGGGIWTPVSSLPVGSPVGFSAHQSKLYLYYGDSTLVYDGAQVTQEFTPRQTGTQFAFTSNGWVGYANGFHGLVAHPLQSAEVVYPQPYFPRHNRCQHLCYVNKTLYVTPCATDGNYGLCFNNDMLHSFTFPERTYSTFDPNEQPVFPSPWWNLGYPAADPNSDRVYASSWENGILIFQQGQLTGQYDSSNSCLSGVGTAPGGGATAIRIPALAVDNNGTLWTAGQRTQIPLASITREGVCTQYPLPANSNDRFNTLLIDDNDRKWFGTTIGGILVWESNQSYRVLSTDNANLPANNIRCMTKDRSGQVWVGTTDGVTVFYNPQDILTSGTQASCPLVEGFCMLRGTEVADIVVDGANRKWVASTNSGLFLFNDAGNQLLAHYEFRRSPMLSNSISDLEWVPDNGELFIATDRGLVSLKLDTTQPRENNADLLIYPNPLFTDYRGPVTLDGTTNGAVVRITTASGLLVRELRSKGGRTVWDGRDVQGNLLAPGIYLALVASPEGQNPGSTQFVVLDKKP
ncbi:MAG: hypothetical protein KF690_06320 [Bacteroidetes bacterium]|nr:hypothetical protein [Bacteroidota bacterium]